MNQYYCYVYLDYKKGRIPWNKGKPGLQLAWNKGLPSATKGVPRTEEVRQKMKDAWVRRRQEMQNVRQ